MSVVKCFLGIAVMAAMILAEESNDWKINAWGFYSFYKVVSGFREPSPKKDIDFTGAWLNDFNAGLKIEKCFENKIKFRLHMGGGTANLITDLSKENREFLQRRFGFYLIDAAIERTFHLNDMNKLMVEFGYLPVRYNPQAANLGEYLFGRSTPYPAVITSGFELADKDKVAGVHFNYTMNFLEKSTLKLDEYFFTETERWPIGDFSDAFLAAINLEQLVEIGGGVNFHHMISVDKRQTTPGLDKQRMGGNPNLHAYISPTGDTTIYTATGTKLMGRITLNPRALIPWEGFGSEDMKLYAELAILGVKNYPGWYENINERMPVMFGFNFPTFKLLDVLSIQLQWFGSKYFNTWESMFKEGKLVPYVVQNAPDLTYEGYLADSTMQTTYDDWKWSMYMSRKINNRVRVSLQFASDNMFKNKYMPGAPYSFVNYTELCSRTWWRERVQQTDNTGAPMFDDDGNPIMTWGKEKWGFINNWYMAGRIMFYF